MSEVDSSLIYKGVWTDWSRGRVLGATLTTNAAAGNLIIAVMAILVTVASGRLWNILLFGLHQLRANRGQGNASFQQQQIILRALPPPGTVLPLSLKLLWSWRSVQHSKLVLPALMAMSASMIYAFAAIVAGIFSSYAVSTVNLRVLTLPSACVIGESDLVPSAQVSYWPTDVFSVGQEYAKQCYVSSTSPSRCNVFAQPSVGLKVARTLCPFQQDLCQISNPESAAVSIDSGLVDSNDVLGINAPVYERVMVRKVTTAAPLNMEGRIVVQNASQLPFLFTDRDAYVDEQIYSLDFGARYGPQGALMSNATAYVSSIEAQMKGYYGCGALMYYARQKNDITTPTGWQPLPEFRRDDADTIAYFIVMEGIRYRGMVNDPVFSAHDPHLYCVSDNLAVCSKVQQPGYNFTLYRADRTIGAVGLTEQYQACLVDSNSEPINCTDLTGLLNLRPQKLFPFASSSQLATFDLIIRGFSNFNTGSGAGTRNPLILNKYKVGSDMPKLPDDQWVQEASFWEASTWASMQYFLSTYAVGFSPDKTPVNLTTMGLVGPTNKAEEQLCSSQIVLKAGDVANISVFALSFAIAVCGLLFITETFLFSILVFMARFRRTLAPRVDRWIQDGVLQVQRRSYELEGFTGWQKLSSEVPIYPFKQDLPSRLSPDSVVASGGHSPAVRQYLPKASITSQISTNANHSPNNSSVTQEVPPVSTTSQTATVVSLSRPNLPDSLISATSSIIVPEAANSDPSPPDLDPASNISIQP